jgi:uncharacterized protein
MTYPATPLTTPSRHRERATYDRDAVHELLDSQMMCHVAFVVDGQPRMLPTLVVRVGETIYLHGSTAATWLLKARREESLPIVVSVAAMDALVLARSQPHHSVNYRSVVVHGEAELVTAPEAKQAAMAALIDKVGPGRSEHTRPATAAELAQTAVLALSLEHVSMKRRTGGPLDDEEDLGLPCWAGVIPLHTTKGIGEPAEGVTAAPPPYVPAVSRWHTAPTLTGDHVVLEPIAVEHAAELFAALDDPEVWEHTFIPRPHNVAEMEAVIQAAIDDPARVPWAKRLRATGELVGSTCFYNISETHKQVAIGYTHIGMRWWRTAVNTESKLLLLCHAFDVLGCERVEWHADVRNLRSCAAIERLGAAREGDLRRHRLRNDGSWRDTAQFSMTAPDWPNAKDRLVKRLAQGSD